jgi:cytochrome c oxidase subunit 2
VKRRLASGLGIATALTLAGCGQQSPLSPNSSQARDIATLWWWMLGAGSIVFIGAVVLLLIAWRRRDRPGLPIFGENERLNGGLVVLFGMVIPGVTLIALFVVANVYLVQHTEPPKAATTSMRMTVIGHQWFWEVRYPGTAAVTANEIHIPVQTRVDVAVKSDDVIHSFWVPELNRKIDLIPGRTNHLLLEADDPGVYRGQCAEFCGLQHAHMVMKVFVEPPDQFRSWLENQARPTERPTAASEREGGRTFMSVGCASCHTIRGTAATGDVGPDLTHVGGRTTIAGATLANTPEEMRRWIADPQHFKPGAKMPGLDLTDQEVDSLTDYLQGLR